MNRKVKLLNIELGKVILVPFENSMAEKYYEWMQNPDLLEATSTDQMTLEEVRNIFFMYQTDPNKYAYMICDRNLFSSENPSLSMIGDVNLFVNESLEGELNIMIANENYRKQGIASEVIRCMISLCSGAFFLSKLIAKISESNQASQRLFKKLGFSEYCHDTDFHQVHYCYMLSNAIIF
ncbi:hypothetical protein SteCoe_31196 [Stentor coeruleus]|uniref:N-acetyltransferase domain-containing protein n=1 Tax=Stentor coeruleus TaxID=5963 RepID=A0A1R2B1X3_9CILI|nr:hypothetical protein SteCoe_31196 [Stentor coeruleus]